MQDWTHRRRHPRVKVDLDIRVVMAAEMDPEAVPAQLKMLGAGGGFLETNGRFDVGSNVTIHFRLPSTPEADILCTAQVRLRDSGKGRRPAVHGPHTGTAQPYRRVRHAEAGPLRTRRSGPSLPVRSWPTARPLRCRDHPARWHNQPGHSRISPQEAHALVCVGVRPLS